MKRIYRIIAIIMVVSGFAGCESQLDLDAPGAVPTEKLYETVDGAFAAMDGIYRSLATPSWTGSQGEQSSGLISTQLAVDLMGEDMVQREMGSGWYYYHYRYMVREYYTFNNWTSYEIWYMWYTVISQMNEIIAYAPASDGDALRRNSLMGQAYAMRGFAYFNLIRWFQKTYVGHEEDPGVPVYTEPATAATEGRSRGTVRAVYEQINRDIDSALIRFENAESQIHKSHIDKYVTLGFRSRVALVMEDWQTAAEAARAAREKEGLGLMSTADLLGGFNKLSNREWMWGMEITETQTTGYACLWAHMDARIVGYAQNSRKLASNWLYERIRGTDVRKEWFRDPLSISDEEEANNTLGPDVRYNQQKFHVANTASKAGDYLYMRAAEMYLNEAEARCHLGEYTVARQLLTELIGYKDDSYAQMLEYIPDGNVQTLLSTEKVSTANLLDEVLLQRRIELWGEGFRMFDVIRLKSGFNRNYTGNNHSYPLRLKPESWKFVLLIPYAEFQSNPAMNPDTDQNPLE